MIKPESVTDWQAFGLPFNDTAKLTKYVNTMQTIRHGKKVRYLINF